MINRQVKSCIIKAYYHTLFIQLVISPFFISTIPQNELLFNDDYDDNNNIFSKGVKMESPLKDLRKKLNFTQHELATLANESQVHISDVEKGFRPIDKKLIKFIESIGIDPEEVCQKQNEFVIYTKNQLIERAKTSQKGVN